MTFKNAEQQLNFSHPKEFFIMSAINFEHYKVFYFVAKMKNITSAAAALYLSQPSVSRCISNLEDDLNCTLFIRSKKGVSLTPEGELLFKHIQIACKHIFTAEEEISIFNKSKSGIIRLGVSEAAMHSYTIKHIIEFHHLNPMVKIKIDNMTTPDAIEALRSNLIDAAVVTSPFADKEQLSITVLDTLQDILVAGNEFSCLLGKTISMHDISMYPLISLQEGTTTRHYLDHIFRLHNILLRPDIELASLSLVLPLVRNNLGIGFIPKKIAADDIKRGDIFEVKLKEPLPHQSICAVTCTKYPVNSVMRDFLECVSKSASE